MKEENITTKLNKDGSKRYIVYLNNLGKTRTKTFNTLKEAIEQRNKWKEQRLNQFCNDYILGIRTNQLKSYINMYGEELVNKRIKLLQRRYK